ncbi:NUDIX domain-containing protein [Patescibacteria group bacterium]|nr:NUDIX domain-containing protein [Patescibacteria group bacterium]
MKISKDSQGVVFRKKADNVEFLLLKKYDPEQDRVDFRLVKGGIEEGEKPEETILREINEETSLIDLNLLNKLEGYSYQATDVLHEVSVFIVENTKDNEIKVDSTHEGGFTIESANWFSSQEAQKILFFDQEKELIRKALDLI